MMEDKRKHIINEVIETERAYVSFLSLLVQAYAKPLKELAKAGRGVIDVHSVRSIFSDVETIHFFNSQLLADLSAASARCWWSSALQSNFWPPSSSPLSLSLSPPRLRFDLSASLGTRA